MHRQYYQSIAGLIKLEADEKGITSVTFEQEDQRLANTSPILEQALCELKEYFEGSRTEFTVPLNPVGTEFQLRVWDQLQKISFGKTISYQSQATELGNIKAIRAVAGANGQNPIAILIPCHRVIGSDGSLTGYAGGLSRKEWLLHHEGAIAKQLSIF